MARWSPSICVGPTDPSRAASFFATITNIIIIIGRYADRVGPDVMALTLYFERLRDRIVRLVRHLEAGTWRPCAPAKPRPDRVRAPHDRVRFTHRKNWLHPATEGVVRQFSIAMEHELNKPETLALLAPAQKQLARLLRPLARLTGMRLALLPKPAPRQRKPRPRKPRGLTLAERREALHYRNAEGKPTKLLPPRWLRDR